MAKAKLPKLPPEIELSVDFKSMVNLCAVFTDAQNQLDLLGNEINTDYLALVDDHKEEYAELQEALTKAENALEVIATRHPDWFPAARRSVKTPYGTVAFHASSKLEVKNAELSLLLVDQLCEREVAAARREKREPRFTKETLIRTETALNLEGLENFSDAELKALRIERVKKNNFSVKPAKVDMGTAVKEAAKEAA